MKKTKYNITTVITTTRAFLFLKSSVIKVFRIIYKLYLLRHDHVSSTIFPYPLIMLFLVFFISCKDNKEPVLDMQNITAPVIISPENGDIMILSEANANDTFPAFEWKATQYHFDQPLANTSYSLQMDIENGDFVNYTTLISTNTLKFSLTNEALNTNLLLQDLVAGVSHKVNFRVASFIVAFGGDETRYSNIVALDITPYETDIYYPPIYLLGDATTVGWDAVKAIETPYQADGVFSVIQTLKANGYYKFIANLGSWAPQWGTDGSGTWENGSLVYRATESDPDPSAIPSPPDEGLYQITIDTLNMIYTVSIAE